MATLVSLLVFFFFFNDTATTEIYTLSLHDALPISVFATRGALHFLSAFIQQGIPKERFETARNFLLGYTRLWEQTDQRRLGYAIDDRIRSEEHTSELQSRSDLVCRLLLEKKKTKENPSAPTSCTSGTHSRPSTKLCPTTPIIRMKRAATPQDRRPIPRAPVPRTFRRGPA